MAPGQDDFFGILWRSWQLLYSTLSVYAAVCRGDLFRMIELRMDIRSIWQSGCSV